MRGGGSTFEGDPAIVPRCGRRRRQAWVLLPRVLAELVWPLRWDKGGS
jgi:hypothetical protein